MSRDREWKELQIRMREEDRIHRLKEHVARREEAQRIRAYLTAVEEKVGAREGEPVENGAMRHFLDWAHRYADRLDPIDSLPGKEWLACEP